MRRSFARRSFLKGVAGAVAIPMLSGLMGGGRAEAQAMPRPRRCVFVFLPHGQVIDHWMPTGTESAFTLSPALAPLAPFQAKINVIHGLQSESGHYPGYSEFLTGKPNRDGNRPAGGPSLDYLLGRALRDQTPIELLALGVGTGSGIDGTVTYSAEGLPLPRIIDPRAAFSRVVRLGNPDPVAIERDRAQQRSVLDSVVSDFRDVQGQLATRERVILDAHLALLRDQEQRLMAPVMQRTCSFGAGPAAPAMPAGGYGFDEATGHQIDLIASALICDVTRVVSLQLGDAAANTLHPWVGSNTLFHTIAHGEGNWQTEHLAISRWHYAMVARLLARLDAVPEGAGTVLDNTVVMVGNELGQDRTPGHARSDIPVLLAGGCGGFFRTGRFLDMGGAHYHNLLLTLAHAMGQTTLAQFGTQGTTLLRSLMAG